MLILLLAACTIQEDAPDGAADDVVVDNNDPGCAVFAKPHLDFGLVGLGFPSVLEINIRNDCAGQLEVSNLAVTPSSGFSASLLGPPVLAEGEKTRISVGFAPWSGDDYAGELWIEGLSVAFTERLPLTGAGDAPRVRSDRDAVSFADLTPGCSNVATVELRNDGYADLTISGFEILGDGFEVGGLSLPAVLAPGARVPVTVTWTAASFDVPNGQLVVLTDDPFEPELDIGLSGTVKPGSRRADLFEGNPRSIDLVVAAQGAAIEPGLDDALVSIADTLDTYDVKWRGYLVTVSTNGASYEHRGWRTNAAELTTDTNGLDPNTNQAGRVASILPGFATAEKPGKNDAMTATLFAVDRDQLILSYLDTYENGIGDVSYGAISPGSDCGDLKTATELRKSVTNDGGPMADACDTDWAPDVLEIAHAFVADAVGFELAKPALDGITATVDGEKATANLLPDGRTAIVAGATQGAEVVISYVPEPSVCP